MTQFVNYPKHIYLLYLALQLIPFFPLECLFERIVVKCSGDKTYYLQSLENCSNGEQFQKPKPVETQNYIVLLVRAGNGALSHTTSTIMHPYHVSVKLMNV